MRIYFVVNILGYALSFGLVAVATRLLGPTVYGQVGLIDGFLIPLSALLSVGFPQAIVRYYEPSNETVMQWMGTVLTAVIAVIAACAAVIGYWFFPDDRLGQVYLIGLLHLVGLVGTSLQIERIRARQNHLRYAMWTLYQRVMPPVLGLLAVVTATHTFALRTYSGGRAIAATIPLLLLLGGTRIPKRELVDSLVKYLKYGMPTMSLMVGAAATAMLGRFLLPLLGHAQDLGSYVLAQTLAGAIGGVLTMPINAYVYPTYTALSKSANPSQVSEYLSRMAGLYLLGTTLLVCTTILGGDMITLLAGGEKFMIGIWLLPALTFSVAILGAASIWHAGIYISMRTWRLPVGILVSFVLNAMLSATLIPKFGAAGAIAGMVGANIVFVVLGYHWARPTAKVRPNPSIAAASAGLLVICTLIRIGVPSIEPRLAFLSLVGGGVLLYWRRSKLKDVIRT